jgi:hypothetical protein
MEEMNVDYDDIDNKSDVSDSAFSRSVGPSSSPNLDSTYFSGEICGRVRSPCYHNELHSCCV